MLTYIGTFLYAQAYIMELEAEVAKLKELNDELQKKQVYSCATYFYCLNLPSCYHELFLLKWLK
jgi:succinate dehydrogenase/fumarate reductase-like Fe-S protein